MAAIRASLRTIGRVSASPPSFRPTEFAAEADVFAGRAADVLGATLYSARTRAATAWLAGFGLVTFAPLAVSSRNGWAFAALMLFTIACIARWVAGFLFERERAQAHPLMIFGLHAAIATGWSAAGLATMGDAYGHGPTLVLVATGVLAAACVPMFERHRDACWWLLAPLAVLPLALPFMSAQPWAWPMAAIALAALGAAAWHAQLAQAQALHQIEAGLRLKVVHGEWRKEQQTAAATAARLEARERDLEVLFEHGAVGIARVNGYVIESVNDHLAQLLGKPADQWVRRDVLSVFAREHHAELDAAVKGQRSDQAATTTLRRLVRLARHDGTLRPVELVLPNGSREGGQRAAGLWLVFDQAPASVPAASASAAAAAAAAKPDTNTPRSGPLDRAALRAKLQSHADQRQRVTVVAVALTGLDALTQQLGDGAARRVREAIVQRLDAVCRAEDAVAVIDDACYAVLMTGEPSDLTLSLMCDRVHSAMATPHTLGLAGAPGRTEAPAPQQRGGSLSSVQFGVTTESLRCELDVHKASTALAQIDEFAAQARAARRRAADVLMPTKPAAATTPTTSMGSAHHVAHATATRAAVNVPTLREDAAIAGRHAAPRAPSPASAEPVTFDRIHIEPEPEDE